MKFPFRVVFSVSFAAARASPTKGKWRREAAVFILRCSCQVTLTFGNSPDTSTSSTRSPVISAKWHPVPFSNRHMRARSGLQRVVRGLTECAVPMSFPFFTLEGLPKTTKDERDAIRSYSRKIYAEPLPHKAEHGALPDHQDNETEEENDDHDPLDPSPEL